jgi:hypothetical protein
MYEGPRAQYNEPGEYAGEAVLALNAVEAQARPITLSWSPGGGMSLDSAAWMTDSSGQQSGPPNVTAPPGVRGSMFRATGDFHSEPVSWVDGLGEHLFVLGNLSTRQLVGVNNSFADSDILDLGHDSAFFGTPAAQLHASMWMMAKSPLMYGGTPPPRPCGVLLCKNDSSSLFRAGRKLVNLSTEPRKIESAAGTELMLKFVRDASFGLTCNATVQVSSQSQTRPPSTWSRTSSLC